MAKQARFSGQTLGFACDLGASLAQVACGRDTSGQTSVIYEYFVKSILGLLEALEVACCCLLLFDPVRFLSSCLASFLGCSNLNFLFAWRARLVGLSIAFEKHRKHLI